MSCWFYQINQEYWPPERFRIEIWENERWSWVSRKLSGGGEPQPGDSIAFFYVKAGGVDLYLDRQDIDTTPSREGAFPDARCLRRVRAPASEGSSGRIA